MLRDGRPVSSRNVALRLASCLVSRGIGVDGTRDSLLTVYVGFSRANVVVKKKVKGLRVTRASLSGRNRRDNVIFVAKVKG